MNTLLFIQTGYGIDLHGKDVTKASIRAVENAVLSNSIPGIKEVLPDKDFDRLKVNIKLAVPGDKDQVDVEKVKTVLPFGSVSVEVREGGMATRSANESEETNTDHMYIVNAAVETGY
ncbi:Lin0512 family protein [Bacillus gobiensis]|uniref:Lin0512 family protein n=1 Tax=Bacillus gobiensis TaxID=1441095 RepID=UPI003D20D969